MSRARHQRGPGSSGSAPSTRPRAGQPRVGGPQLPPALRRAQDLRPRTPAPQSGVLLRLDEGALTVSSQGQRSTGGSSSGPFDPGGASPVPRVRGACRPRGGVRIRIPPADGPSQGGVVRMAPCPEAASQGRTWRAGRRRPPAEPFHVEHPSCGIPIPVSSCGDASDQQHDIPGRVPRGTRRARPCSCPASTAVEPRRSALPISASVPRGTPVAIGNAASPPRDDLAALRC